MRRGPMSRSRQRAAQQFQPGESVIWMQRLKGRKTATAHRGVVVETMLRFVIRDNATGKFRAADARRTERA
jgi:hypothetical protein